MTDRAAPRVGQVEYAEGGRNLPPLRPIMAGFAAVRLWQVAPARSGLHLPYKNCSQGSGTHTEILDSIGRGAGRYIYIRS